MTERQGEAPFRASRAARWAALACLAAGCARERVSTQERYIVPGGPGPGGERVVVEGPAPPRRAPVAVRVQPIAEVPWTGRVLPIASPDGTRLATESAGDVPWATRVGDPPPVGMETTIEVISLRAEDACVPLARIRGPWILGRSGAIEGFPVERPRADGARDISFATWEGTLRPVAEDGWCNAHCAASTDGALAWCRRQPEGGPWEVVIDRSGARTVFGGTAGGSLVTPMFAGDGSGVFAIGLNGTAASATWLHPVRATGVRIPAAPLSAAANISWAIRASDAVSGGAWSAPPSGRLMLWSPDTGRMLSWMPGSDLDAMLEGSVAGIAAGEGDSIVTTSAGLFRERTSLRTPPEFVTEGAWALRPLVGSPGDYLAMLGMPGKVRIAKITISGEPAAAP